jgi:hypothetical protein
VRITVQSQPRQKSSSQQKKAEHGGTCCHPSYSRKIKIGGSGSMPAWAESKTLSQKWPKRRGLEAWLK